MANSPIPHPTCPDVDADVGANPKQQQQQQQIQRQSPSRSRGTVDSRQVTGGSPPSVNGNNNNNNNNMVNPGEDDEMRVYGYRPSLCRQFLAIVLVVVSGGLAGLVFYWKKVNARVHAPVCVRMCACASLYVRALCAFCYSTRVRACLVRAITCENMDENVIACVFSYGCAC